VSHDLRTIRAACETFLQTPTDDGLRKLRAALVAESRAWQGFGDDATLLAIHAAKAEHAGDEVNVDGLETTDLSVNDEGVWVQGWLFVSSEMLELHASTALSKHTT